MPIKHKATLPLCRPGEPAFMPKLNYCFDIPAEHLAPRYKEIGDEVLERINAEKLHKIPVKPIEYPNLDFLKKFDVHLPFSPFISEHCKFATALIKIFDAAKDLDELISLSLYCRDQINKQLFIYAYSVVLTHRYDSDSIPLPQYFEIAPHKFFSKEILTKVKHAGYAFQESRRLRRQATQDTGSNDRDSLAPEPIVVPFRGTMNVSNPEEKLAFFREDIGINSHHLHWHIVYPIDGPTQKYYDKDRRGELNYYMHHQVLNWYDCNRLSQRVPCVQPFDSFRESLGSGYFPNMTTSTSSYIIPSRQNNAKLHDLHRDSDSIRMRVNDMEQWYHRLQEAVDSGYIIDPQGKRIDILNDQGIENLFNLTDAGPLSKNAKYYGDLHSVGHIMISLCHDPLLRYKEQSGVMGDTTTAMRDPIFFRWHKMLDNLGVKLKSQLWPHEKRDLQFKGVKIKSLDLVDSSDKTTEQLITFWQSSTVNVQNGLDFHANTPSLITFTHLNYQHFSYVLSIENTNAKAVQGTIRIFILPVYDESGQQYLFEGARMKAIEIDRFPAKFPTGISLVKRSSTESTMTIPFDRTYPMQKDDEKDGSILLSDQPEEVQAYCMCGWPQNCLLPKGNQNGYPFRIFIMISDYEQDKIDQPASNGVCNANYILCGLQNRKYPDKRPMGFPLDRPGDYNVLMMADFTENYENMITKNITIRHLYENKAQVGNDPNQMVPIKNN